MAIVNRERRYVRLNAPALLAYRGGLADFRGRCIDDFTPASHVPAMRANWARLLATGALASRCEVVTQDGGSLRIVVCGSVGAADDWYVLAFAPEGWTDAELAAAGNGGPERRRSGLTPREVELLQLAAEGRSGPRIAEELSVSPTTVKTHFENIYAKLGVRDRAAAVAKGMRLGLIR
jgi:DNA-binding CsgD family transcriptional regulator